MKRAALAAAALIAACSGRSSANYRHCLKLRVGMTTAEMISLMGEPAEILPYVEGKSLPHLKGRTAYEWPNPAALSGPNHVSIDDASGKIASIRCSDVDITAGVFNDSL